MPNVLDQRNGLLQKLQSMWVQNSRVMIICADPSNYKKNDIVCACLKEAFPMSGLSVSQMEKCDNRNPNIIDDLEKYNVLIFSGGHVPTQNRFMKQLSLKERLKDYNGIILAWSAGAMNCADTVYAGPELEGEAVDPNYERWISGLGLTDINIFPHFNTLRDEMLDGMRLIEDITLHDSFVHEIIALNNGSYILLDSEKTTLYGEAYMIKNGQMQKICSDGETVAL